MTQNGENANSSVNSSTDLRDFKGQYFSGPLFGKLLTKKPVVDTKSGRENDSNGSIVADIASDSNGRNIDSSKVPINCELEDSNGENEIKDSHDSVP